MMIGPPIPPFGRRRPSKGYCDDGPTDRAELDGDTQAGDIGSTGEFLLVVVPLLNLAAGLTGGIWTVAHSDTIPFPMSVVIAYACGSLVAESAMKVPGAWRSRRRAR